MYRKILIATDGSELCERAARHGVALAKALGAGVVGVTVLQPLHTGAPRSMVPSNLAAIVHEQMQKLAAENLAGIERVAREAGVPLETMRESDDHPWQGILRAAKSEGADLIVMASHGRRGVAALVLGSETQKVLTHSPVPVLVVR